MTATRERSPGQVFGPDLLADLRQAAGISQYEVGRRTHYDHSTIGRWEDGNRQPSREAVLRLAAALCVSDLDADRLLCGFGFAPVSAEGARWWADTLAATPDGGG